MKVLRLFSLLTVLLALFSCQKGDDVEAIFTGKVWHLGGFYFTANWNHTNDFRLLSTDYNSKADVNVNNITFYATGTAVIVLPGYQCTADWQADGSKRTFSLTNFKTTSGTPGGLTSYSKEMYEALQKVAYYRGDSNYIQLFDSDKLHYMQFGDKAKF